MIKKIIFIFNPRQRRNICILFFLMLLGAFFETLGIAVFAPLISLLTNEQVFYSNDIFNKIRLFFNISTPSAMAVFITLFTAFIFFIKNLFLCVQYSLLYRFVHNNTYRLSVKMMHYYMYQDYLYHATHNIAKLHRSVSQDVSGFFSCILSILKLFVELSTSCMLITYLFLYNFEITFPSVLILSLFVFIFSYFRRNMLLKLGVQKRKNSKEQTKWFLQSFEGIKDIKTLGREQYFISKYDTSKKLSTTSDRKYSVVTSIQKPIIEVGCFCLFLFFIAGCIFFGTPLYNLVSTLGVFAVAAFRLLPAFNRIMENYNGIMYNKIFVDELYEDLLKIRIKEGCEQNKKCCEVWSDSNISICCKNLSFRYPARDNDVLNKISFDIPYNKSVALIGESGAGKSTLADIILGHLHPSEGDITVDGVSIFDHLYEWHDIVGYIPQSIYLIDDTLRNNIAFGVEKNSINENRVWQVLDEAQLADFVKELPNGLDTYVGDRGVRLSGGQRQRIGIARALYHNPKFIVFDEATSSLDAETESAVMDAINSFHGNRTILIIAHRLTTIKECDLIYRISNQQIYKVDKMELNI